MTRILSPFVDYYRAAPRLTQIVLFVALMSSAYVASVGIAEPYSRYAVVAVFLAGLTLTWIAEHESCSECGANYSALGDNYCSECGHEVDP